MDLLFSKYASPFTLLDGMIATGRLLEFTSEFLNLNQEEVLYTFYLHKIFDQSFDEFKASQKQYLMADAVPMSNEEIEATIKDSKSMLEGFKPS